MNVAPLATLVLAGWPAPPNLGGTGPATFTLTPRDDREWADLDPIAGSGGWCALVATDDTDWADLQPMPGS